MNLALKEWASVVAALDTGLQICLLRKGGIVDVQHGRFQLKERRFLFFPTYEHEHRTLVNPPFQYLVTPPAEPGIAISMVCDVTGVFAVDGLKGARRAESQFIWNDAFLRKRIDYRPDLPLYCILLRAFRLPSTVHIPNRPSYAGCKSVVHLTEEIDTAGASPVLDDAAYEAKQNALFASLG